MWYWSRPCHGRSGWGRLARRRAWPGPSSYRRPRPRGRPRVRRAPSGPGRRGPGAARPWRPSHPSDGAGWSRRRARPRPAAPATARPREPRTARSRRPRSSAGPARRFRKAGPRSGDDRRTSSTATRRHPASTGGQRQQQKRRDQRRRMPRGTTRAYGASANRSLVRQGSRPSRAGCPMHGPVLKKPLLARLNPSVDAQADRADFRLGLGLHGFHAGPC
jgi:hypothetical protein